MGYSIFHMNFDINVAIDDFIVMWSGAFEPHFLLSHFEVLKILVRVHGHIFIVGVQKK